MLEQNGFKDIERLENGQIMFEYGQTFTAPRDEICQRAKEEFFTLVRHITNNERTEYKNEIEKTIMARYANGIPIRQISYDLKRKGMGRTERTVFRIIGKYLRLWNLKK